MLDLIAVIISIVHAGLTLYLAIELVKARRESRHWLTRYVNALPKQTEPKPELVKACRCIGLEHLEECPESSESKGEIPL